MPVSEIRVVLRSRSQLTLPGVALEALGVAEGDALIVEIRPEEQTATLRPVRRSYAGALAGVYGDADAYTSKERESWE
ncbi:MAG TPA: AbrB/MazE/SpoVT family DNA-binding domain-containing protein [Candidatus Baltobacteraceae bacterium]|nr:AbrB/MazE/SpoVT family DNA-binding domain-containing protein [Candidatus Baltobacteraceae bacterium]